MNHFIWITDINNKTLYLLASQVVSFVRHTNGQTVINLTGGNAILTTTKPEELESRMNKYMNDMLAFVTKKGGSYE